MNEDRQLKAIIKRTISRRCTDCRQRSRVTLRLAASEGVGGGGADVTKDPILSYLMVLVCNFFLFNPDLSLRFFQVVQFSPGRINCLQWYILPHRDPSSDEFGIIWVKNRNKSNWYIHYLPRSKLSISLKGHKDMNKNSQAGSDRSANFLYLLLTL